jgi:hypothetical protein
MSSYLDKPWPRVTWDKTSLEHVAQAVRMMNPHVVYSNDESAADYIRSESERTLYRANQPEGGMMCGCGGWQVCFTAGDTPGQYSAWPSVTGYTALRYAKEQQAQPA